MKNRHPIRLVFLAIVFSICLALVFAGWVVLRLPERAEALFGPPAETLGASQRLFLSAQLLARQQSLLKPFDLSGVAQAFRIDYGESTYSITQRLEQQGLVGDAELLRKFLIYSGLDKTLQAGEYILNTSMTPMEIARSLQDATPTEVDFRILPGWRLEEIAAALPTSGLSFTPDAFLAYTSRPPQGLPVHTELPEGSSLEGFLFPDSYHLARDITIHEFVQVALADFETKVDREIRLGFEIHQLDLYAAVTLASIIEREAIADEEMPMIASVFHNRLAAGMRLDSDPTIQYALGFDAEKQTWWKNPLSLADLQTGSPYNTYQVQGLPPGPIANPGLPALKAVAFPAQTPYYYFRAACDNSGRHVFAETYEQHQANACP